MRPFTESQAFTSSTPSLIRKLIRSRATNLFLANNGQWTNAARGAAFFSNAFHAYKATQKLQLQDVELYYLFFDRPDSRYDFAVPLE